jgi:hypothetical protein
MLPAITFSFEATTMTRSRRIFIIQSVASAGTLAAMASAARAQPQAVVVESEAQAVALGYREDGSKTDPKKYPNYASSQSCSACVLFQGKATDSTGRCAVFGNKLVASKGWCSAFSKKT